MCVITHVIAPLMHHLCLGQATSQKARDLHAPKFWPLTLSIHGKGGGADGSEAPTPLFKDLNPLNIGLMLKCIEKGF